MRKHRRRCISEKLQTVRAVSFSDVPAQKECADIILIRYFPENRDFQERTAASSISPMMVSIESACWLSAIFSERTERLS